MAGNTTQVKEQTRNTEVQINEEEIGKLPEKEFRKIIVKMIKNLEHTCRKCKKARWLSKQTLYKAEERREAKSKGEKGKIYITE